MLRFSRWLVVLFISVLVLIGCIRFFSPSSHEADLNAKNEKTSIILPSKKKMQIFTSSHANLYLVAELDSRFCSKQEDLEVILPLDSYFGSDQLVVTLSKDKPEFISVELGGGKVSIFNSIVAQTFRQVFAQMCEQPKESGAEYVLDKTEQTTKVISPLLSEVAPQCTFQALKGKRWFCTQGEAAVSLSNAELTLRHMQTDFVKKLEKVPYILSRKIAITTNLISEYRETTKVENFCNIVSKISEPELPLIMRQKNYLQALCAQTAESGQLLQAAIPYVFSEIEYLKNVYTQVLRRGFVSVKIDQPELKDTKLWVEFKPNLSVRESVQHAADRLRQKEKACWSPLLATRQESLALLFEMQPQGKPIPINCSQTRFAPEKFAQYLVDSLLGETSFVMTNGQRQSVSLLSGDYTYELKGLQGRRPFRLKATDPASTSGRFAWNEQKPHLLLKAW